MVQFFTVKFLNIIDSHTPNKFIRINDKDAPVVTPRLKNIIRKSHKAYNDWVKKGKDPATRDRSRDLQSKSSKAIEKARSKYI